MFKIFNKMQSLKQILTFNVDMYMDNSQKQKYMMGNSSNQDGQDWREWHISESK